MELNVYKIDSAEFKYLGSIAYLTLEEGWEEVQQEADEARVLMDTKEQKGTLKGKWLPEK